MREVGVPRGRRVAVLLDGEMRQAASDLTTHEGQEWEGEVGVYGGHILQ